MAPKNNLEKIASNVPGLDLWQPRDWPHRRGDPITLSLLTMPIAEGSPGGRAHACENCSGPCLCIADNVLCWKCKSTFCLHCTAPGGNPNSLLNLGIAKILESGFGKCHRCQEPLRSIALVDVFRTVLEQAAGAQSQVGPDGAFVAFTKDNPRASSLKFGLDTQSLVREAEQALKRGQEYQEANKNDEAIGEYTHAINAINYTASLTKGSGVVLRAHDILLIAHGLRAELEDNLTLQEAIIAAYPRASVKDTSTDSDSWHLSKSAFEALFWSFPGRYIAGSGDSLGVLACVDMRTRSKEEAFASPTLQTQFATNSFGPPLHIMKAQHPHCDGKDDTFDSMNGTWQGLYAHQCCNPSLTISVGPLSFKLMSFIQFVSAFPSDLSAAEYTRVIFKEKLIGEEESSAATDDHKLVKLLKKTSKEVGVQNLQRAYVLKARRMVLPGTYMISVVVAVGNVSTKIFISALGSERDGCHLAAMAIAYLDRQLRANRSPNPRSLKQGFSHPDLTVCAYCGKDGELKACTRCKLAKYCGVDCQKKHWSIRGEFGHSKFCKDVVKSKG